jgi:hypothetical protein
VPQDAERHPVEAPMGRGAQRLEGMLIPALCSYQRADSTRVGSTMNRLRQPVDVAEDWNPDGPETQGTAELGPATSRLDVGTSV